MSKKGSYRQKIEKLAKTDPLTQFTPEAQEYIKNAIQNGSQNGFGVGNFNVFGFPQNQAFPGTEQLSRADTMFNNLRWYLVSNFRQLLSELYIELGLVQTICDVPVDDGLRGGIEIKSKQLEDEEIEDLQISLDRDDDLNTAGQAAKWNRLFGGAGILILTDQDPEEPIDIRAIGPETPLEFRAVDMWELFWDKQNTEGYDPAIQTQNFEFYNYYAEQVHKSRVMRLKGMTAPSFIRPRLRGWGFSICEQLVRSMNQYLKATDATFECIDEFKIDVYKIKNLVNTLLSPNGQQKIQQRVAQANFMKNYQNALVIDSEDDWDHKELSFTGIAEVMQGIRMQVASDMRMPMIKLFGTPATGLNASDEDSIEVYNSMVEAQVRNKLKYDILRICEIKCQKLFGFIPDDLSISFKPLRVMSAEQEENVKTQKANRLVAFQQAGLVTTFEVRDAINRGALMDIVLDNNGDVLNPNDPEILPIVKEGAQDPSEVDEDTSDPGADREDSRAPKVGEYGGLGKEPKAPTDSTAKKYKPAKPMPKQNKRTIVVLPKPFTQLERVVRIVNGPHGWDKTSFETAVAAGEVDPAKLEKLTNKGVDLNLWMKVKKRSLEEYGNENRAFMNYLYKKLGGKFT